MEAKDTAAAGNGADGDAGDKGVTQSDVTPKNKTPGCDTTDPEGSTPPADDAPSGVFKDGYGLEVQGHQHICKTDTEAVLFLPKESPYRIRVSNANDYLCMVSLEIDGMPIGTLLLNAYSKCDLERPIDRPLGFMYGRPQPAAAAAAAATSGQTAKKTKPITPKQMEKEKTRICATFKPEMGGKVIQVDVTAAGEENKTQRLELLQDTTVHDLLCDVQKDFGDWVMTPQCALIHWTTAEYDSPVEDVLRSDVQTMLRNCKRRDVPLRKMTLISLKTVEIKVENEAENLVLDCETPPTIGNLVKAVRERVKVDKEHGENKGEEDTDEKEDVLYFLTESGRDLCSTRWAKDHVEILQLMHKDEILQHRDKLILRATSHPTPDLYQVYARLACDNVFELHVGPCTTVRELRFQLEVLGGPWGEDPSWLYGGTLMESGLGLIHYGIGPKAAIDVIPRIQDKGEYRMLQMRDPISVEGVRTINTAEMIHREDNKANKKSSSSYSSGSRQGKDSKRRPHRGATVLKGRIKQQFVEVDPIEIDQRFIATFTVNILPKEREDEILEVMKKSAQGKQKSTSCLIL